MRTWAHDPECSWVREILEIPTVSSQPGCDAVTVESNYWVPAIQSRDSAARDGLQRFESPPLAPLLKYLFPPY